MKKIYVVNIVEVGLRKFFVIFVMKEKPVKKFLNFL